MKIGRPGEEPRQQQRGIALVIVMIVIVVLATLAAGFAYSMKVETKLARNASFEADMDMLGRSGVELARYILAMQLRVPPPQGRYTALNQKWAGGPATTNELLIDIQLEGNKVGAGTFSLEMVDLERKFNLSMIRDGNAEILERALDLIGVDAAHMATVVDSYLDWIDRDDQKRIHGAESDFYERANPRSPYVAKNGLMDDISELLLLQGVTPSIYWGSGRTGEAAGPGAGELTPPRGRAGFLESGLGQSGGGLSVGLVDLFTTISGAGMAVNVNTASAEVLQLLPGVDPGMASAIIQTRAGPDHMDGTEDDIPFEQNGDLASIPGMDPAVLQAIGRFLTLQSYLFEVRIHAEIGSYKRTYVALLHRRDPRSVNVLYFHAL